MTGVAARSGLAAGLASFASDFDPIAVPDRVRDRARLHFLDAIGCGLAAVGTGSGAHATRVVVEQAGRPQASLLGNKERVPAALAGLANGTRCHALDFDDTHERGICHSSAVIVPVAFALGQALDLDGAAVLDAYVLGSEVALRIAAATADGLYARGFHPTSVCGVFGATAAACWLQGLDRAATSNALGIAGSFGSGLLEYLSDGSATKPLHAGWAGHGGIQATQLAAAGATGPATVIEGRFGLVASHTDGGTNLEAISKGLGKRWEFSELTLKPYSACHFAHASTWAAGQLAKEHQIDVAEIAEVVVRVPAEGLPLVLDPIEDKITPRTAYDAKFSLPYTVAHQLVHGHLDLSAFSRERIGDSEVLSVAERVRGGPLKDPPSRFAGSALIRTSSGAEFERLVEHTPGSPRNPLEERSILSKFQANAELAPPDDQTAEVMGLLRCLDELDSVERVGELIEQGSAGITP